MVAPFDPAKPAPVRRGAAELVQRWGHFTLQGNEAFEHAEDFKARQSYAEALAVAEELMLAAAQAHDARAACYAPALFGIACNNIIELARRQGDGLTAGIFQCKLAAGFLSVMESNEAPLSLRSRCLLHSRIASSALCSYFEERGMWDAAETYTARANAAFFAVHRLEASAPQRAQVVIQPAAARPIESGLGDEVVLVLPDDIALPDGLLPGVLSPESLLRDAMLPEAMLPDATLPDATLPDAMAPDAMAPEAMLPAARVPDPLPPEAMLRQALLADVLLSDDAGLALIDEAWLPRGERSDEPLATVAVASGFEGAPPSQKTQSFGEALPLPEALSLQEALPSEQDRLSSATMASIAAILSHDEGPAHGASSLSSPPALSADDTELSRDVLVSQQALISNEALLRAPMPFPEEAPRPSLPPAAPLQPPKTARSRLLQWLGRAFFKRPGRQTLTSLGDILRAK